MKELKQTILDTVSILRNLFFKWRACSVSKIDEICKLEKQVAEQKKQLEVCRQRSDKEIRAPSSEGSKVPEGSVTRSVAPPNGKVEKHIGTYRLKRNSGTTSGGSKLYAEAVSNWNSNNYTN
jgi:hypothetical protein